MALSRLAVVDIGSNAVRLLVAEVDPPRGWHTLARRRVPTRLARQLATTGRLDPQAAAQSLEVLAEYRNLVDEMRVDRVRAVATCAVREAENGAEFRAGAEAILGAPIEVITARREAELALAGVRGAFPFGAQPVAVVDIGGGSAQIVLAAGDRIDAVYETSLGAVRLSERFPMQRAGSSEMFARLVEAIDSELRQIVGRPPLAPSLVVGTGGTFGSIETMLRLRGESSTFRGDAAGGGPTADIAAGADAAAGRPAIRRQQIRDLLEQVRRLPVELRGEVPGLARERADIIVAGLAVADAVLGYFGADEVRVHHGAVREGVLYEMLRDVERP